MPSVTGYCEVCGRSSGGLQRVMVEGSEMLVCPTCLSKLGSRAVIVREERRVARTPPRPVRREKSILESLDLVEDFGERVRRAREAKGWSEAVLAQRLRVSVDVVRRIESGKFKPPVDLARRIEGILGVKILVPTEEEELETGGPSTVTLGDIVVVRRGEE